MGQDLAPLDVDLNIKLADSLKIRGTKGSHSIVCYLRYSVTPHERVVKIYEYLWDDEVRGKEEGAFEVSDCITSHLAKRDHWASHNDRFRKVLKHETKGAACIGKSIGRF